MFEVQLSILTILVSDLPRGNFEEARNRKFSARCGGTGFAEGLAFSMKVFGVRI